MLSTVNPPPDPLCPPCEEQVSPNLKNSSCFSDSRVFRSSDDDENGSSGSKQCQQLQVVDLLLDQSSSALDDNRPLPKFSIRDYVLSERQKDIKTNWPFSQKSLQLCRKYNLKDVLPPFQSLDSIKNPSLAINENTSSFRAEHNDTGELAVDAKNINPSESEQDKEFISSTTSESCTDINSGNKNPVLEAEAATLPGTSVEKPEFAVPVSESDIQKPAKKCRLILKLNNVAEPKSSEEISTVTEAMASKVCPVCKTFSSSSNTTLNAHIDQCLSGESTVKWTENSKLVKHRIKQRKMRSVVDIYETALPGTLEDLDRRNGTNWASNLGCAAQDLEVFSEEKNNTPSLVHIENPNNNNNEESAVYIDSSGTKVRILSKFNDGPSSSAANCDNLPKKVVQKEKSRSFLSSKKPLVNKQKTSKCPPEVDAVEEREFAVEGNYHKEDVTLPLRTNDQPKSDNLGMIKQWVVSKRTGLRKKINVEHEKQHPYRAQKKAGVKSNIVSLDRFMKRTREANVDENPRLRKRKDKLSCDSHDKQKEQPGGRNAVGFSSTPRNIQSNNSKQLGKDGPSVRERCVKPPNGADSRLISHDSESLGPCVSLRVPHEHLFSSENEEFGPTEKTSIDRGTSSGRKEFSSLRGNLLSVKHGSSPTFKKKLRRKFSDSLKPRVNYSSQSDEDAYEPRFVRRDTRKPVDSILRVGKGFAESLIDRPSVVKVRKKRELHMSKGQEEEDTSLEGSDSYNSGFQSYGSGNSIGVVHVGHDGTSTSLDGTKEVEIPDDFVCEPTSGMANNDAFIAFGKTLGSPFQDTTLDGEQEIFSVGKVGKYFVSSDADLVTEIEPNEENGNYIVDVEPIPIPGPPGSFLPSPGRMGSEELPGSSSLTSCKIQSSEDEHELVDRQSSDSPISSTSMASTFVAARSNSVSFMNLSGQSLLVQNETQCNIKEKRMEPSVESSPSLNTEGNAEGNLKHDDPASNLMLHETAALGFKNDQPCCCSRKEAALLNDPSSDQEPPLLMQQTSTSLAVPVHENNVSYSRMRYAPESVSLNSEVGFQIRGDYESPSPSSPNPVLRLMGKNLMVVNKDENLQSCVDNGGNMHHPMQASFHPTALRAPAFENAQRSIPVQHFDFSSSHGFKVPTVSRTVQFGPPSPTVMFSRKSLDGSFTSPLGYNEYAGGCNLTHDQLQSNIRLDPFSRSHNGKFQSPVPQRMAADFPGRNHNNVIVIDDSPENEPRTGPVGSSAQTAWEYDSRHVNPLYSYSERGYPLYGGSRTHNANLQVPPSKAKNGNLVEWIHIPESSSLMHASPLPAPSPSTGYGGLKPITYPGGSVENIPSLFSISRYRVEKS